MPRLTDQSPPIPNLTVQINALFPELRLRVNLRLKCSMSTTALNLLTRSFA